MRLRTVRPPNRWVRAAARAVLPAAILAASAAGVGPAAAWGQTAPGKAIPGAATPGKAVPNKAGSDGTGPGAVDCGTNVAVDLTANGSTVCVQRGGDLVVMLPSTGGSWSAPHVTGTALGTALPIPTPYGTVGWMFPAVASGTATVTVVRSNCPSPDPATGTCQPPFVYRVHVLVP